MKLNVESLSGIIANNAVFRSPICSSSISSKRVKDASSSKLKAASRTPTEIRIDLAVLPETNRQGLFNQIHKKSTKKVPEAPYGS